MTERLPSPELEKARNELRILIAENKLKGREQQNPHLESLDPDLLTETEAELWLKARRIGSSQDLRDFEEGFTRYREELALKMKDFGKLEELHRTAFFALVGGLAQGAMSALGDKELRESKEPAETDRQGVLGEEGGNDEEPDGG